MLVLQPVKVLAYFKEITFNSLARNTTILNYGIVILSWDKEASFKTSGVSRDILSY